jgi:hypothetical protein
MNKSQAQTWAVDLVWLEHHYQAVMLTMQAISDNKPGYPGDLISLQL